MGRVADMEHWDYCLAISHIKHPASPNLINRHNITVLVLKNGVELYDAGELSDAIEMLIDEEDSAEYPYLSDP
jgi:hypothetical protein